MLDIPEEQVQIEYEIDLIKNGHVLYMASSGYGKTMFLTNIILGLAMKNSVKNMNCYIIDLGNSALIPLKKLPHVADYMGLDDIEKINKFIRIIKEEMAIRKRKFAKAMAQNISVYNETSNEPLSIILIAIDNYDAIKELGDAMEPFLQKLSRDGASLGIFILTTLTRNAVMRSSVMNNFKERIVGFNFENTENRALIGKSDISLPEDKKGRTLVKLTNVNLMQVYTPVPCETEIAYMENLKELVEKIATASTEKKALGIPILPEELYISSMPEYPGYEDSDDLIIPVGIETEYLKVKYVDLTKEPILILGSSGTGRTNILACIIQRLLKRDYSEIFVFDAKNAGLRDVTSESNISYAWDEDTTNSMMARIKEVVLERRNEFENNAGSGMTLMEYGRSLKSMYIIVDVIQELYERVGEKTDIIDILAEAYEAGIYIIVTSDVRLRARTSKFLTMLTDSKNGVVLGSIREQTTFSNGGLREDNHDVHFGYIHERGSNTKIMLPQPD